MIVAYVNLTAVEVEDVQNGRVLVRTLDGSKPFSARVARSDPEAIPEKEFIEVDWAWVAREDLSRVIVTALPVDQILAAIQVFDKAQEAVKAGKVNGKRLEKGLSIFLTQEKRPYRTTANTCDCPDSLQGNFCKHRLAALIGTRVHQTLGITAA